MGKLDKNKEKEVVLLLQQLDENAVLEELLALKTSDETKYSNTIIGLYEKLIVSTKKAEKVKPKTTSNRGKYGSQRTNNSSNTTTPNGNGGENVEVKKTYAEQFIDDNLKIKKELLNIKDKFNELDSKKITLTSTVRSVESTNALKLKHRSKVIDRCNQIESLREVGLDKARYIIANYPSAINRIKQASSTKLFEDMTGTSSEKLISDMENELLDALTIAKELEGRWVKFKQSSKIVIKRLVTFNSFEMNEDEKLLLELRKI